ncbi:hypothetical protein F0P96_08455 [Hymenobacter busanensis]|uniref:Uncharacterized protein n=1 Tax=Hymenobacter busanensis TaxID=2607656 RepID=A0A7L5A3A0_9BACT|nr:hypothetical protein [Hymenobacter busanensis]KAA9333006.1 hypothetical protein F0P96_08455 [Hymenobacter busanensis]QHJ08320.1 hypothetical protein GUY19_13875 [Hymenobacter busanensis]
MKTHLLPVSRLFLLAACAGLGFTSSAQAQSSGVPQPVSVQQVADFTYVVRASNPHLERSEMKLVRLSDNKVLYRDVNFKPSSGRKLNVKELNDGQYAFVVRVGKDIHRYTLDIHTTVQRSTRLGSVSMTAMAANQ